MKLIVGLGNPGKEYQKTRHNIGFMVLDYFAERNNLDFSKNKFNGNYTEFKIENEKVLLDIVKGNCSGHTIMSVEPNEETENTDTETTEAKSTITLYIEENKTNEDSITKVLEQIDDNKKSLMDRIKETINNIFKQKPKTYKLTDGQSLEIDGTMPGNPIAKFFNRIADSIDKITGKGKEIKEATATINEPQIISEHPAVVNDKTKADQDPTLLNAAKVQNPDLVFPGQTGKVHTTGSYINSKPAPEITPENIDVDKEDVLRENKEMIADLLEESDSKALKEQKATVEPTVQSRDDNSDDFTK